LRPFLFFLVTLRIAPFTVWASSIVQAKKARAHTQMSKEKKKENDSDGKKIT
jgi:hypothetical protein